MILFIIKVSILDKVSKNTDCQWSGERPFFSEEKHSNKYL